MNKLIFILLLCPLHFPGEYPLKDGKPTSKGIEQYVEERSDSLIIEFQDFIGDTLFDVWIYAEEFDDPSTDDSVELGHYYSNEVYISTAESFIAYELADLSRLEQRLIEESNKFVKSTIFHELSHDYINQISVEMQFIDKIGIDISYQTNLWLIRSHETLGSRFIEEGICEYLIEKMGEIIPPKRPTIPKTIADLTDRDNTYQVLYKYSGHYLKPFLDSTGFKAGVKILLYNAPPTYEEMLSPDLFFSRLVNPY